MWRTCQVIFTFFNSSISLVEHRLLFSNVALAMRIFFFLLFQCYKHEVWLTSRLSEKGPFLMIGLHCMHVLCNKVHHKIVGNIFLDTHFASPILPILFGSSNLKPYNSCAWILTLVLVLYDLVWFTFVFSSTQFSS